MPSATVGGNELDYERRGSGEPLVLIQGMSATRLAWGEEFLAALAEDFDCIAFDNRGIGRSSRFDESFTIADLAADTLGLLDALAIERAHVLGISMGGMVAQELALAHPERLLTLILGATYCGGPGSQLMAEEPAARFGAAMASGDRGQVLRTMWELNLSPGFRADESRYEAFHAMATASPARRRVIGNQIQALTAHDASERLAGITTPTLVIHGSEDQVLPPANGEMIASLIPAPLELLEGVGHMFWWEQPQRAAALIRGHARSGQASAAADAAR